jgi:predicted transposase YbfD/YdcC
VKIREVIKNIQFDAREERVPRVVLKRFISCVEGVSDKRDQDMIDYPLPYVLLLAFLAVLSGADAWTDMEDFSNAYKKKLNGILPQYKGIPVPSHDTFRRVMGLLKPEELQLAVTSFLVSEMEQLKRALGIEDNGIRHLGIDGKEQRGSGRKYDTPEKVANLQTLHCYDISNALCLYSVPISDKTNEIPVAQSLLGKMQLKNCVVTFDAMNTQKETVRIIHEGKGDFVGGLKGNQQTFYKEVVLLFSDEEMRKICKKGKLFRSYTEKAHNRLEKRTYYMTTDIQWFADLALWPGMKSFICYEIETEELVTGNTTVERRYYISSLTDIELCSDAIRGHWGIENQLHWHLDATFSEDDNSTMDKNAFNNLSILNKMALTLLKLIQPAYKRGLRGIRKTFGWDLIQGLVTMLSLLDEEIVAEALTKMKNSQMKT